MKHLNALARPFVEVDGNKVTITVQDGIVSKNGVNGIQAFEMISLLKVLFTSLNTEFPCNENEDTLYYLARAYSSQLKRNTDRVERGVESKLVL